MNNRFVKEYEHLRKEAKQFVEYSRSFAREIKVKGSWFNKGYEEIGVKIWLESALKNFILLFFKLICNKKEEKDEFNENQNAQNREDCKQK